MGELKNVEALGLYPVPMVMLVLNKGDADVPDDNAVSVTPGKLIELMSFPPWGIESHIACAFLSIQALYHKSPDNTLQIIVPVFHSVDLIMHLRNVIVQVDISSIKSNAGTYDG